MLSCSQHRSENSQLVKFFLLPLPSRFCFRRCLSVCLLATLRKNFQTDLHVILREGWQWANEQMIKFWWWSRSRIRIRTQIRIRIAILVRRALAEVCTALVLLVFFRYRMLFKRVSTDFYRKILSGVFGRLFVKRFVLCYRTVVLSIDWVGFNVRLNTL